MPDPEFLDPEEKDLRLVEFITLVSIRGCGDLDPEPAAMLLEDAGWDVAHAFSHLCGGEAPAITSRSGIIGDESEFDFMRLQQEAWASELMTSEVSWRAGAGIQRPQQQVATRERERPGRGDAVAPWSMQQSAERSALVSLARRTAHSASSEDAETERFPAPRGRGVRIGHRSPNSYEQATGSYPESETTSDNGIDDEEDRSSDETIGRRAPAERGGVRLYRRPVHAGSVRHQGFPAESGGVRPHGSRAETDRADFIPSLQSYMRALEEEEEEALRLHTLVNALVHAQDEADLQDALRVSGEEAYSGGFSAPPADEALVAQGTRVKLYYRGNDGAPSEQCAVCLMDFEDGEALRSLSCKHRFHVACVDQWFTRSGNCPTCKRRCGC